MENILLLAHTEADGSLGKAGLEALGAALLLKKTVKESTLVAGLIGSSIQPAANLIASCGAARFLGVVGADFGQSRYASDAAAAEAVCRAAQATLVVAPATARWNRVLAGVAHRLGGRADSHVTGLSDIDGRPVIHRWYYRQRMEAQIERSQRPWFMLIDPGSQPAWEGAAGTTNVEPVEVKLAAQRTMVIGLREPAADAQTIRPEADLLFVAGAGWTKKQADGQSHVAEAEKLIHDFLSLTRASLGSSKSLVDLGGEGQAVISFLTHLNQIGQTGATPRHPKGLSACCHGEEPHTVGWRFINERRAISLDANCGWARGKADVVYVADAFAVVSKMNELLEAERR
ncbi:MAG: electron transfer flavoprotein subunit alpha [Verrucomicrobia bacterium]|nr:electron transfer flavoprotein subunit alpha [Verrucomicrobiota bacterium]